MSAQSEVRFDGRAVVVTGAGRGLGRAQAVLLAARGAKVLVADNGTEMNGSGAGGGPAGETVDAIAAQGGTAVAYAGDLATREGSEGAVAACLDSFGRIDALAHYASNCPELNAPDALEDSDMELSLAVNPLAAMRMARAAWPHMVAQGYGRILLVPSGAVYGALGNTPYAAGKGALIGVVKCLACEGVPHGIRVNGLMPAASTRMTQTFLAPDLARWIAETMPPEKVANGAGYLLAEECAVNGELFVMGGDRIARVRLAETEGVLGLGSSLEHTRAAMPAIMADERYFHANNLDERFGILSGILERGDQAGGG